MLSRKTVAALVGLVVALLAVIAVVASASTDSAIGKTRAHLGDAAESVGDALTVPSPTPSPTADPVTPADVQQRVAAETTRLLLNSALGHLAQRTPAGNLAASKEYDLMIDQLDVAGRSNDPAVTGPLFADAAKVRAQLLALFPPTTASATPTPTR